MNKKGSVLLLSLLIISALLSSVLYVSALSLRQISQSVNSDNALIAFYTAESGNEQAIYKIRKKAYSDISELNVTEENLVYSNSSFTREVTDEMYGITTGIYEDQFFQVDLFDSENLLYISKLSYLEIGWDDNCDSNSWIEITSNDWDASGSINWFTGVNQDHIKKSLLDGVSFMHSENNNIDNVGGVTFEPNKSYQFRLKALYCDVYNLRLVAYDSSGSIIPFKNIYNIKSIGQYPANSNKSNKQALSASLRKFSPLSGLFDYVIFSEKSLIKDIGAYSEGWFSEDLFITTVALNDAVRDNVYINHLNAINGILPYRWKLISGTIPSELKILEDGTITGIVVSDPGIYSFRVVVIDAEDSMVEKNLQIKVLE
ncbi:MAG: hypothetical protein PHZ07_03745 [Patescibacteria group bacterium]|nr:hypothetical protein [Patescibacteria group bacterium]MDD4304544.1 hypothetical protein [Patescibacteria group bacterium]